MSLDISSIRGPVRSFYRFLLGHLQFKDDMMIEDIFRLLPLNPSDEATRHRIESRERIRVSGSILRVTAPPQDNMDFRAIFVDGIGGLGRIIVTFRKSIQATASVSGEDVSIDFGSGPIPVTLEVLANHPLLGRDQLLKRMEFKGSKQVVLKMQDRNDSNLLWEIIGNAEA